MIFGIETMRLWFCFCGFNITILASLFAQIFGYLLGRWRGALAAGIAIAAYTLLVGASPSVVRAAIMLGLASPSAR
jgi:predicted membrane metal-binding protein